jgi:hypothetical protein
MITDGNTFSGDILSFSKKQQNLLRGEWIAEAVKIKFSFK